MTIFKRIGKDRLAQDLSIYSVGLFPLVRHAAMSVRPKLLGKFLKNTFSRGPPFSLTYTPICIMILFQFHFPTSLLRHL